MLRFWGKLGFVCGTVLVLALVLGGCASSGMTAQVSKGESVAATAIAKLPHAKVGKLVTAEVIANPYRAMKSLHWPARIMVVTYDGTFSVPTPCPSGKGKCDPVTFHSATAVLNPTTDAVLETVEPGWPAKGSAGGSRTGPSSATKGGK